jgi:hypothetical protein
MPKIVENNTSSPSTLALARRWLNECLSDHPKCRTSAKAFIPTYLVDVGQEMSPTPRLCRGEDLPAGSKYMTLSHCWGQEQTARLLEDRLEHMLKGIGFNSLSKTFQDAITVVQRLGQRYLWMDSLCITQDSPAHWLKESMLMGEIYANGICNISATASHNGSGGLFFDRNPDDIYPIVVQVKENGATRLCSICDPDLWNDNIINSPLNQRAWVCQERLLSRCNLHFAANQVFWECNTTSACETFPATLPPEFKQAFQKQELNHFISRTEAIPSDVEPRNRPPKFWNDIVSIYTSGALTFPTDKLVALGGLAAQMQRISKGEYLAGMWRERLVDQLGWFPLGEEKEFSDPTEYLAPTWSWASFMQHVGGVWRAPNVEGTMFDIVDAQVELASSNPFGQVKSGRLVIKGKLARAAYCETKSGKKRTRQVNVQVDDRWELHSSKRFDPMDLLYVTWSTSRDRVLSRDGLLYLLPCYKAKFHMPGQDVNADPGYDDITGLVLVETGNRPGEFFRCGTFFLIAVGNKIIRDMSNIDNGCRFFDARCAETSLEYKEDPEHGLRYTVTII